MTNHGIEFLKNKYLTFFLTIQIKVRKFNYLYSLLILKTFTQKLLIISFPENFYGFPNLLWQIMEESL